MLESSEASFYLASEDSQSYNDGAKPIATEATQYTEQIAVEEEEPEDMLLSRSADKTDLSDWYFIWVLHFNSVCFYRCVYFCKKS